MTLVTQERELHVLGSAAVTMRNRNSSPAGNISEPSNMWGPLLLLRNDLLAFNASSVFYSSSR